MFDTFPIVILYSVPRGNDSPFKANTLPPWLKINGEGAPDGTELSTNNLLSFITEDGVPEGSVIIPSLNIAPPEFCSHL